MTQTRNWDTEAKNWKELYLLYDDNAQHMELAFCNLHPEAMTGEELHAECKEMAGQLLAMGLTEEDAPVLGAYTA